MSVSVVIPTTLERPIVPECVNAAVRSALSFSADAEVLLVANRVPPGRTYEGPAAPILRILQSDPPGVSRARNAGVAAARHDTVLFVDDDLVVPRSWCAEMYEGLRDPTVAVAGPVRLKVLGPITSFMDYQRPHDAMPLDGNGGGLLITANAGYRRDLAPPGPPFDVENYPQAGEDTDLALRLRAAGGRIGWIATHSPPLHHVEEEISAVVGRSIRDGHSCARLYHRHGRPALSQYFPSSWRTYTAALAGRPEWIRQFSEISSTSVRAVFATLSLVSAICLHAGYLKAMGEVAGLQLVNVDEAALIAELASIVSVVIAEAGDVPAEMWQHLPVSLTNKVTPAPLADRIPVADIAAAFNRHAPRGGTPPSRTLLALSQDDPSWLIKVSDDHVRSARFWAALAPRVADLTVAEVEMEARQAGLTLGSVLSYLELSATSPTRPGVRSARPAR